MSICCTSSGRTWPAAAARATGPSCPPVRWTLAGSAIIGKADGPTANFPLAKAKAPYAAEGDWPAVRGAHPADGRIPDVVFNSSRGPRMPSWMAGGGDGWPCRRKIQAGQLVYSPQLPRDLGRD